MPNVGFRLRGPSAGNRALFLLWLCPSHEWSHPTQSFLLHGQYLCFVRISNILSVTALPTLSLIQSVLLQHQSSQHAQKRTLTAREVTSNMAHQHPLPPVHNTNNPVNNEATSHHHPSLDHREEYEHLSDSQLKALCRNKGYASSGNRDTLTQRLRQHDTRAANAGDQQSRGVPPAAVSVSMRI